MKMTKWRPLKKNKKSDGQGAQSFKIGFGAGDDHRDSPESRLGARETAFEPPSPSALGRPVAQTGGRWKSEEKMEAQRKESMKLSDAGAKKNENKNSNPMANLSSTPCSLPPKAFNKPRKFDRGKLAKSAMDSVASLTNGTVTFSGATMESKQSIWTDETGKIAFTEKGKKFEEDDQVMMITVKKEKGKCDVLYLNAASANEDIRLANRATFPVGTSVEEILDRRPPKKVTQSVFRDYKPGERRERELVPFTFDDDDNAMSNSPKRGSPSPVPLDEVKRPTSPRKRDRPLRKSAKETDAEQGCFLTAMGSEEGEKSSSSSTRKSNNNKI